MKAIIEMPQGSVLKYEMDKDTGTLILDRVLNQPVPYNYGFVPFTLCGDGDPLDVFVIGNLPIYPLTAVKIEILGVLNCIDNGEEDDKLIAMIDGDEQARHMGTDIIRTYLTSYKTGFEIVSSGDSDDALDTLLNARRNYQNSVLDELYAYEQSLGLKINE